jgi:hypothetical protein
VNGKRGSGFAGVREASVEIVVIRADGTVEPRGLVSYYHQNILLRWCVGLWIRRRARRLEGASRARRERSELMRKGRD